MAEFPDFTLWTDSYLADTQDLATGAEHGAFLLILIAMWRNSGFLLCDDERLCTIAKTRPEQWKRIRGAILDKFRITPDGRLFSPRMLDELENKRQYRARQSAAGKSSAQSRRTARDRARGQTELALDPDDAPAEHRAALSKTVGHEENYRSEPKPLKVNGVHSTTVEPRLNHGATPLPSPSHTHESGDSSVYVSGGSGGGATENLGEESPQPKSRNRSKLAKPFPPDWEPSELHQRVAELTADMPSDAVERTLLKFRRWAGNGVLKKDWHLTWERWLLTAYEEWKEKHDREQRRYDRPSGWGDLARRTSH